MQLDHMLAWSEGINHNANPLNETDYIPDGRINIYFPKVVVLKFYSTGSTIGCPRPTTISSYPRAFLITSKSNDKAQEVPTP